jgi:hypothetical protein
MLQLIDLIKNEKMNLIPEASGFVIHNMDKFGAEVFADFLAKIIDNFNYFQNKVLIIEYNFNNTGLNEITNVSNQLEWFTEKKNSLK